MSKIYLAMEYWEVDGYYQMDRVHKVFMDKEKAYMFCDNMNKNLGIESVWDFDHSDNYFFVREMEVEE